MLSAVAPIAEKVCSNNGFTGVKPAVARRRGRRRAERIGGRNFVIEAVCRSESEHVQA